MKRFSRLANRLSSRHRHEAWMLLAGSLTLIPMMGTYALRPTTSLGRVEGPCVPAYRCEKDTLFKEDVYPYDLNKGPMKLNEEAIKLIQFDFTSSPNTTSAPPKTAEMEKSWMNFRVDLSVPKNLTDTTRVRKPTKYIRMLPYTIWTRFGEDPVFDVLVFGNKKRLEVQWTMDLDLDDEEYGRNLTPQAGRMYDDRMGSSVVIDNLDIIGFLYDHLNKHGRTLKRNRKRAKAWKVYQSYKPTLNDSLKFPTFYLGVQQNERMDSCVRESKKAYEFAGIDYRPHTVRLLDPSADRESPADYRLLQSSDQRSRFGKAYLPSPFEAHPDSVAKSLREDSLQQASDVKVTEPLKPASKRKRKSKAKQENEVLEELPDRMDDLYRYIRMKQAQDSLKRKELFRKDKVSTDIYETEKQLRRFKERQE